MLKTDMESGLSFIVGITALLLFPILLYIPAPYGRFSRKGWGYLVDGRLGWIVFETVPIYTIAWTFLSHLNNSSKLDAMDFTGNVGNALHPSRSHLSLQSSLHETYCSYQCCLCNNLQFGKWIFEWKSFMLTSFGFIGLAVEA